MQRVDGAFVFSASDLNDFLECRRLTELEELVALGRVARPAVDDEQADLIRAKGEQHESAYLASLERLHPGDIVRFERAGPGIEAYRAAETRTLEAMRSGAKLIYQATFFDGQFIGHADFLRRVEVPSNLGSWSYEVIDTKLALSEKPYYIVQLCNYAEHLLRLQGVMPERGYIVQGDGSTHGYRIDEFLAYYRHLKNRFLAYVGAPAKTEPTVYPVKRGHCGACAWDDECTRKRIDDDHLSLVARMRRDQTAKLEHAGITTLAALAQANGAGRPATMSEPTYERLHDQAALQLRGRIEKRPIYTLLQHDPRAGFGLLPAPADGDLYFDMEGDPIYEPGRKLEYLFGCWSHDEWVAFWALSPHEEKKAFEDFVDFVVERRKRFPTMHVYHYAPYEKTALQHLAQQHQTREDEVDDLLRSEVLVDLYAVVRQSLLISDDSYSIKRLEKFYGFERKTDVKRGDDSIVMFETWRLTHEQAILDDIEAYNRDDCRSTYLLHQWLLERREEAQQTFAVEIPFRPLKEAAAPCHETFFDGCTSCVKRAADEREDAKRSQLERDLLARSPYVATESEFRALGEFDRIQYLLAHLLAYHRREEKPAYWEYFHRCANQDDLVDFDGEALGGLELCEEIEPVPIKRSFVYTYRYPDQRHKMGPGKPHDPKTQKAVEVLELDDEHNLVRVKRTGDATRARELEALIPEPPPPSTVLVKALVRVAEAFVDGTLRTTLPATFDLLAARDPRTTLSGTTLQPAEVTKDSVSHVVQALDRSYLFIQGPPGSGKSTDASHAIADLLEAGKRVGVTSTGHKAIQHLLHKVETVMHARGKRFRGRYKHGDENSVYVSALAQPCVESAANAAAFACDDYDLAGGTAWLFARDDLAGRFDYLFIDEAGQVPLANAIAVSTCAQNVVLLGDPSQLAQVSQGSHAPHVDDSILQHLLGEGHTVSPERGIFLDHSYRMHPDICRFISEAMYDGRLAPGQKTAHYRVESAGLSGSGLRYIPVEHDGNGSASSEEAERVVEEIRTLLAGHVVDRDGTLREMRPDDIIVVTPYNAQRRKIAEALRRAGIDVRVGTVDKFQGQEASVVFYSMATSSSEDGPRDLNFLFEQNRFNVAISRAQAMSVLVCAPTLLDASCRTVDQMRLVNVLCDYVERASALFSCSVTLLPSGSRSVV